MVEKALKERLSAGTTWLRLLFMVIYAILTWWIFLPIALLIAAVHFFFSIFTGAPNKFLLPFGESFSKFVCHILRYLTYATNEKPFPFSSWPACEKCEPKK